MSESSLSGICFLLPSYNNAVTVGDVADMLVSKGFKIIAVNDGSTDGTEKILEERRNSFAALVSYRKNRGKGYAIRCGLKKAAELGFSFLLSIDADGQHDISCVKKMLSAAEEFAAKEGEKRLENTILIGSRAKRGKDGKSRFANDFSNFWFRIQTLHNLPDTQSGCRLYPVKKLSGIKYFTTRYEFELEILVRGAWKGMNFAAVPVDAIYEQENRVSHFRPGRDFTRISVLNTFLTIIAPIYGYPKMLISRWKNSF